MATTRDLLTALHRKDFLAAHDAFAALMQEKVNVLLARERKTLVTEAEVSSGYTKKAVIYDAPNSGKHVNCVCGKRCDLTDKDGGGSCQNCGRHYDGRGYITESRSLTPNEQRGAEFARNLLNTLDVDNSSLYVDTRSGSGFEPAVTCDACEEAINLDEPQREIERFIRDHASCALKEDSSCDWADANKGRFEKEYGKDKGDQVLYAKANKMKEEEADPKKDEGKYDAKTKTYNNLANTVKRLAREDFDRDSGDDDDVEFDPECPACGGPGVPLGTLGRLAHFRCRDCGTNFSQDVSKPNGFPGSMKEKPNRDINETAPDDLNPSDWGKDDKVQKNFPKQVKEDKKLPVINAGSPLKTNASINREYAVKMFQAGMSVADIVKEFPEVFKSTDGKLGQKYDYELGDGSGRYETKRLIEKSAVDKAIAKFKGRK